MKAFVIPDVHLKPWMFERASELMEKENADVAICLMDIPDDWGKAMCIPLYEETFDAAIKFSNEHQCAMWCWGNHDLSYQWGCIESGYSPYAEGAVLRKLSELRYSLNSEYNLGYVHRVGNVLFSHGGVTQNFVWKNVESNLAGDTDLVVTKINHLSRNEIWTDNSPIWARPQNGHIKVYSKGSIVQVVGHTPVKKITQEGNVISCDTFSTYPNGDPIGNQEFLVIDCDSGKWYGVK